MTRRASVAAPSDGTEKAPASHPVLETPAVAKVPRSASRQKPQARANLVSATVDLVPDKLALIRQHCSAQTPRISDPISQAVEDDLRKPR